MEDKLSKIASFQGPYRFLSNFWPVRITYQTITFPSVEHAYQAAKTFSVEERRMIAKLPKAGDAKRAGKNITLIKREIQIIFACVKHAE